MYHLIYENKIFHVCMILCWVYLGLCECCVLTHWSQVMPIFIIEHGHDWFRLHQATTWMSIDLSSIGPHAILLKAIAVEIPIVNK